MIECGEATNAYQDGVACGHVNLLTVSVVCSDQFGYYGYHRFKLDNHKYSIDDMPNIVQ